MKCVLNKVLVQLLVSAGVGSQCPAGAQSTQSSGHPRVQSCRPLASVAVGSLSSGSR